MELGGGEVPAHGHWREQTEPHEDHTCCGEQEESVAEPGAASWSTDISFIVFLFALS